VVNPELGLPDGADLNQAVGHIRSLIRSYGEVLEDKANMSRNGVVSVYNKLVDAVIVYSLMWSKNRGHEPASMKKAAFRRASTSAPIYGNYLILQF
jgi:4-diphosphocytidyl-2C-methyl-D-erythritol kinase